MKYKIENFDKNKNVWFDGYTKIHDDKNMINIFDTKKNTSYTPILSDRFGLTPNEGKILLKFIMNMPIVTQEYFNESIYVLEHDYYNDDGLFIYSMDIELTIFKMVLHFNKISEYKKYHWLIDKILKNLEYWSSDYIFMSGFYLMNEKC